MHSDDASDSGTHDSASPVVDEIVEQAVREATGISEAAKSRINGLLRRRLTPLELWLKIRAIIDDMSPDLERVMAGALLAGKLTGRSHVAVLLPDADYAPVDPERFFTFPVEGVKRWRFPQVEEAARFLAEKRVMLPGEYSALDAEAKQEAFTIAGVGSTDALTKIRRALVEDVAQGGTLKEFRAKVEEATGGTALSPAHIETIYRTNIAQAYREGQQRMMAHPLVADEFPYVAAEGIDDVRRRPEHRWFNTGGIQGTNIFRVDDPVYRKFFLPWGWNCRCVSVFLSREDAAKRGIREAQVWVETGVRPEPPAFVAPPPFDLPEGWEKPTLNLSLDLAGAGDDWLPLRDSRGKLPAWYSPSRRRYRYQLKRPDSRGPGKPGAMRTRPVSQQQKIGPAPATPPGTASPVLPAPPKLPTPSVPTMIPAAGPVAAPLPQKANTALPVQQQGQGPQAGPMPPELEQARAAIVKAALDANPNHPVSNPVHEVMAVRLNNRFVNTITSPMDAADHKAMQDLHTQIGMEYQNRGDHERALGQFAAARFHYDGVEKQGGTPEATPVDEQLVTKDQQEAKTPTPQPAPAPAPQTQQAPTPQPSSAPTPPQAAATPALLPRSPLTPQQQAKAESQPFKQWFAGSKVVDERGVPVVVHHGTGSGGFLNFDDSRGSGSANLFGPGHYFTESKEVADEYNKDKLTGKPSATGETKSVFLNIKNPLDMNAIKDEQQARELVQKTLASNPMALKKALALMDDPEERKAGLDATNGNHGEWAYNSIASSLFDDNKLKGGVQADHYKTAANNALAKIGYDGITHTGGLRVGSGDKLHKVWIAFKANQIMDADAPIAQPMQSKPPAPPVQAQPVTPPQAIPVQQQKPPQPPPPPPQATPVPVPPKPPAPPPMQQAATPPQPQAAQRPAPTPPTPTQPATTQPAPQSPSPVKVPPGQKPLPRIPVQPHQQAMSDFLTNALHESAGLDDGKRHEYHAAVHRAIGKMPVKATDRIGKNLERVRFRKDLDSLAQIIGQELYGLPDAEAAKAAIGGTPAGAYDKSIKRAYLNGPVSHDEFEKDSRNAHGVYAHEFTHALDGPTNEFSTLTEWVEASKQEAWLISKYAGQYVGDEKGHAESFAEFGRLLYGSDVKQQNIERILPMCSAFFKKQGLWPS